MGKRRSKKRKGKKKVKGAVKWEIKKQQGFRCMITGEKFLPHQLTIHHMKPRSRNGTNRRSNLVAWSVQAHNFYHQQWGNRTSDRFGNPL